MEQILKDFINNIEPWQVGVALLALAVGKWAIRALRAVMTVRMMLIGAGAALMYPYARPVIANLEAGNPQTDVAVAGLATGVWLATMLISSKTKQPPQLSPEAQKVMAALDKLQPKDISGTYRDRLVGNGLTFELWPNPICPVRVEVKDVPLSEIVKSKSERKTVNNHARSVYHKLLLQYAEEKRQAALDSLT
jgi:hypothetical protein